MNIAATKIELAKRLLNTDDKEIINYIKAIFETREENWFENLPESIRDSVNRGLKQSENNEVISHSEAKKKYQKWLKK